MAICQDVLARPCGYVKSRPLRVLSCLNILPGLSTGFIDATPVPVTPPRTEALLHALAFERRRYKQVLEALHNAHETILTLEAQVARREAELENQDRQRIADVKPIPQKRSILEALHPDIPEVPLSEVVHSLSVAEARNHALEQEVYELNNRVSRPALACSFSDRTTSSRI